MMKYQGKALIACLIAATQLFSAGSRAAEAGEPYPFLDVTADLAPLGIHERNAAGDGTTDDTDAFQRTLDYVAAQGGGYVYAPKGTYRIRTVAVVDTVSLIGAGPDKTVFRGLDTSHEMVRLSGGALIGLSLYGTAPEGSGDNWKVGTGGVGKGGTAKPVTCITVTSAAHGALIDNVGAFEARYDPLYVRDVTGLRVLNSRFDRAGRNVVSLVGNTVDFVFDNCYFGSLWGLYHVDIEQNSGKFVRDGVFQNCVFDGTKAGQMNTDTWGAFLCFHGSENLEDRNITVANCRFDDIYVRAVGVFVKARFLNNTFRNSGPAFVRIPSNKVGEFRDSEIRGNTFTNAEGKSNERVVEGVIFTGAGAFSGNRPESANAMAIVDAAEDRAWQEDHPIEQAVKLGAGEPEMTNTGNIITLRTPLGGHSVRFSDARVLDYTKEREIPEMSDAAGDVYLHVDSFIAIGKAGVQKLSAGNLEDFQTAPREGYVKRLFDVKAGDVCALLTQAGRHIIMQVVAKNNTEIEFKYRFVD